MIVKGKARANAAQLAAYLADYLTDEKNDRIELIELRGSTFTDLDQAIRSWQAEAAATKCEKPLWHAQICPAEGEVLTREQKIEAVDILERHLGLDGQPRAVVVHDKGGHEHLHVVWSRISRDTGRAIRDDFTHKKNVAANQEMSEKFGFEPIDSPFAERTEERREDRRKKSNQADTQNEQRQQERSWFSKEQRRHDITEAWNATRTGRGFREVLESLGYTVARGDRRGYVVVDMAGEIHSLARQIKGADTKQLKDRMVDVPIDTLPSAEEIRAAMRQAKADRKREAASTRRPAKPAAPAPTGQDYAYTDIPPRPSGTKTKKKPVTPEEVIELLTRNHSTFTDGQLNCLALRVTEAGSAAAALIWGVHNSLELVPLGQDRQGRDRYSSREVFETEMRMRHAADGLSMRPAHDVSKKLRDAAATKAGLTGEQLKAFQHVTEAGDLKMVLGIAGTGKSYLLRPAKDLWQAQGFRVTGVALAGKAAEGLQADSGIQSRTLHSLLYRLENAGTMEARLAAFDERLARVSGRSQAAQRARAEMRMERDQKAADLSACKLTDRDVIVLDEAGMVGSSLMNRLLSHAEKAGAKVVLIGDHEQLQAIDAGAAFRSLWDRYGGAEISSVESIRRQKETWQKEATRAFAKDRTAKGLKAYRDHGTVHEVETGLIGKQKLVEGWARARKENPAKSHMMLAYTRADVAELNDYARAVYRMEGRLGQGATVKTADGELEIASGERLYFTKPSAALGVNNGTLGTAVEVGTNRVVIETDAGKRIDVDLRDYDTIAYAYAATIHKGQGVTVDTAHVAASRYMDRHATYVAMSRHRDRVDLYYSAEEFRSFDHLATKLSRDGSKDTTLDYLRRHENGENLPQRFREMVVELWHKITGVFGPAAGGAKAPPRSEKADHSALNATFRKKKEAGRELHDLLHRPPHGPGYEMER